jgi:6-pyruvoyltetrahydropterin/6-carboxytetrahydropterin synthase
MAQRTVIRYHDFCAGHTVTGHESKCAHLHGHNYRVHFHVEARPLTEIGFPFDSMSFTANPGLDLVGRIVDFSVVKSTLCEWLEENWDHKFLINEIDPRYPALDDLDRDSLVVCDFNPTAENMAEYLVETVGPLLLKDLNVELVGVELSETRKCSVTYFK